METKMTFPAFLKHAETAYPREGLPLASHASRIMAAWRCHCAKARQSPDLPPVDGNSKETPEEAASWRAAALDAAREAKAWGSWGSSLSIDEMSRDWLAVRGRSVGGQKLAMGE